MNIFSTEQISKYHPDKYADQISGAILTECLRQDKSSHVACECLVKDNIVVLAGEITTSADIDYEAIVKRVADKLGYKVDKLINLIGQQSVEIDSAVKSDEKLGAGDQGIMFGFATSETDSHLPYAFDLANEVIRVIENDVTYNPDTILKGDAKTQVSVDLDTNELVSVLISVCHKEGYSLADVKFYIKTLMSYELHLPEDKLLINPSGTWTIGGPTADCGLTGRKIVCDQYGGFCAVGGGAFSGKDPSKVDVSAAYMARKIAVDLCRLYDCKTAEVQLGYAIGVAEPVSVSVKINGVIDPLMAHTVRKSYDLTPKGMIEHLKLLEVDYERLAEGCHYRIGGIA